MGHPELQGKGKSAAPNSRGGINVITMISILGNTDARGEPPAIDRLSSQRLSGTENILGIQRPNMINPHVLQTLARQQSVFVDLLDGPT
jgi:hypothetical protein